MADSAFGVYIPENGKTAGSIINDIGRIQQNRRANHFYYCSRRSNVPQGKVSGKK